MISQVIPQWLNQAKERQSQWTQYKSIEPGKLLDAANIEKVEAEVSKQEPKAGASRPSH
ncbi:hypothetical protein [Cesiribacter andamanensis]|uniref:hypothetical protein n=1 Tax=Cesiribacter andamanensis TaxID=649507 RepID=UPI00034CC7CB|nr:hypothetical protein [Cesiribacter andamanensis]